MVCSFVAGAQIIFPESGRGLGHVTTTILAVRSAILATAWLLVIVMKCDIYSNIKLNICNFMKEKITDKANKSAAIAQC